MREDLSVAGVGSQNADTAGGQAVSVSGSGFGPSGMTGAITNVTYGHTGSELVAQSCAVASDGPGGAVMTCLTAPGTGAGLLWRVDIAGQSSALWGSTSYAPPSIATFGGPAALHASSDGQQPLYINGANFGPAIRAVDAVWYAWLVPNVTSALPVAALGVNGSIVMQPTNCSMTVPHTQLCTSPLPPLRCVYVRVEG